MKEIPRATFEQADATNYAEQLATKKQSVQHLFKDIPIPQLEVHESAFEHHRMRQVPSSSTLGKSHLCTTGSHQQYSSAKFDASIARTFQDIVVTLSNLSLPDLCDDGIVAQNRIQGLAKRR